MVVSSFNYSWLWGQASCGTPNMDSTVFISKPWIGNNKFLEDIVNSIGYGTTAVPKSASEGFDPVAVYWIPVKAWVYNDNDGTGGITEAEVEESIRLLDEYFRGDRNNTGNAHLHTLVHFYPLCATYNLNIFNIVRKVLSLSNLTFLT